VQSGGVVSLGGGAGGGDGDDHDEFAAGLQDDRHGAVDKPKHFTWRQRPAVFPTEGGGSAGGAGAAAAATSASLAAPAGTGAENPPPSVSLATESASAGVAAAIYTRPPPLPLEADEVGFCFILVEPPSSAARWCCCRCAHVVA
jgi:hypothetical protein